MDGGSTFGDDVVDFVDQNPDVLYYCENDGPQGSGLHYVIDPTGFGVQIDTQFSKQPAGCSAANPGPGGDDDFNPACNLGTC